MSRPKSANPKQRLTTYVDELNEAFVQQYQATHSLTNRSAAINAILNEARLSGDEKPEIIAILRGIEEQTRTQAHYTAMIFSFIAGQKQDRTRLEQVLTDSN